jgi:ComEC/Rec2-related protein
MAVDANSHVPHGVGARLFVPEGRSVLIRRASRFNPVRWAAALRERFHAAFNTHLPEASAQLLSGVLLGDRPPGLAAFTADFRRSGTFHLLVASGSNVGFALGVWWVFSRWGMWWPRRWTIAGAPFVAFLYALMAGGDPPVLRAAIMAAVGSVGALLGRWDRLEHPLILSGGLLLFWNPHSLFQAGFQMSYAATLAIAAAWEHAQDRRENDATTTIPWPRAVARIGKWARQLFVTSFAAQLALAPFLLYYFGRFSWVGIGANMLAVPLSGLCLFLGAGLAFLDSVWPAAASLWAVPTQWGATALSRWAHFCAKIPGAEWRQSINGDQAIALGCGVILGFATLSFKKKRGALLCIIGIVTLGSLWVLKSPSSLPGLSISWIGGRAASVRVRTHSGLTVIEKGENARSLFSPDGFRRIQWDAEGGWGTDGHRWTDGPVAGEVIRPNSGNGFALLLRSGKTSALLNFGLTARQQTDWIESSPDPVDLLSWSGGKGGPPKEIVLALLRPRWIIYQGTRIPISVRRSGSAVYRPGRSGLHWETNEKSTGFCAPVQN